MTGDDLWYKDARIIDTGRSSWTWDPVAQQYFWHRNFGSPRVRRSIFKVI